MMTYPLTPVTAAACGGTEQMAWLLLRQWQRESGFSVTWIGARGGDVWPGIEFLPWDEVLGEAWAPEASPQARARWQVKLDALQRDGGWELIHNDGAYAFAPLTGGAPVLFTLHLARELYPVWVGAQAQTHWQCVSRTQFQTYGARACCSYITNGIDVRQFPARRQPAGSGAPLLCLGRICPEKAPHEAIAVARRAQRRLWLVGAVAPFAGHQRYFYERIAPELDGEIRWLPPPTLEQKCALLAAAAAVLIPSRIDETSSIVAMEAAAAGVPVLATQRGALPEIVADGETGWLGSCADWVRWVPRLGEIDPRECRERAERLFRAERMTAEYAELYRRLADAGGHY